jgi:pilus assembly protein FimV
VDPVAEADVYMAYGRDAQAEEILLEAKQKDPRRFAIHLKLLEIYLSRKDVKPFDVLATELFKGTGGFGPEWEKAVAMGLQLDPRNPLFASGQQTAPESRGPQETIIETSGAPRDAFAKQGQLAQMTAATRAEPMRPGFTQRDAGRSESRASRSCRS